MVSDLCTVLIIRWVQLGIQGQAPFPELRVQWWNGFLITGRPYFPVFLLFQKALCFNVYRDGSVHRRSRVFVAVGGHDRVWKMLSSIVRWRSNLSTNCLFYSHLTPVLLWIISQWFSFYLFKTSDIYFIMKLSFHFIFHNFIKYDTYKIYHILYPINIVFDSCYIKIT
jgi:hypothetical protein